MYPPDPNQFIPPNQNPNPGQQQNNPYYNQNPYQNQNPYNNPYFNNMPPQQRQPQEPLGTGIWKTLVVQLPIFVGYQIILWVICNSMFNEGLSYMVFDMFPLVLHWLFLLVMMIVCFSRRRSGRGLGYLISLLVTGIIGFGSCVWIGDMMGGGHF